MILQLTVYPDKSLSEICDPVIDITPDHITLINDMYETMHSHNAIGLAAIQVGIYQRIFVMDIKKPIAFINPVITAREGVTTDFKEGCLSFPNLFSNIKRDLSITVEYQDVTGQYKNENFDGLEAICIQHEIDHLNGIVFPDRLSKLKRDMLLKKYKKLK